MSKKFKKFLLLAAAATAAISALVIINKKKEECDSLFEEDDMNENQEDGTSKAARFPVDKNVTIKDSSRTYINLV